jgi:hypothetical protein
MSVTPARNSRPVSGHGFNVLRERQMSVTPPENQALYQGTALTSSGSGK